MSPKKPNLIACSVCGMYGNKDDFTPQSNNTCKKCSRVRQLEQRLEFLESEMKSSESLPKRVSALEEINSQMNDSDLLERGSSHVDLKDAVQGKEERSPEQPKESATVAAGGRVTPAVERQKITKPEMKGKIISAIEAKQYFLIGVVKKDGTAEESLHKYELRTTNLYDRAISNYKVRVIKKVFYTFMLGSENGCYAVDTKQLRDKYLVDPFCLNAKLGEDEFFREEGPGKGIAYLCVYCKIV